MPYPRIVARMQSEVWCVLPATWNAMADVLNLRLDGERAEGPVVEAKEGPPDRMPLNDVVVLPMHGIMGKHLSELETMCGGVSVDAVARTLDLVAAMPEVKGVVLGVDSPGGAVSGVPELAEKIASYPKPLVSVADGVCASAALWAASQARLFVTVPSAQVGSVGVYAAALDVTEKLAKEGVRVNAISNGKYKLLAAPFKPMTEEERAMIQERVDRTAARFREALTARRPIADEDMEGQVFDGEEAVKRHFADATVNDLGEAVELCRRLAGVGLG